MARGNKERAWTYEEYVVAYEQLQAKNERLKEEAKEDLKKIERLRDMATQSCKERLLPGLDCPG